MLLNTIYLQLVLKFKISYQNCVYFYKLNYLINLNIHCACMINFYFILC